MIYERESVIRLTKMRAQYRISQEQLINTGPEILSWVERELFARLTDMAESEAAILDQQDVHFTRRDDPDSLMGMDTVVFLAYWMPVTENVEIFMPGTLRDGMLMQHRGAPYQLLAIDEYAEVVLPTLTTGDEIKQLPVTHHMLWMQGWDESRRLWIYREKV